jgi:hypothetical protein
VTAKEPRIKLKRLLLLFGIVIGSITALGILGRVVIAEWPLVSALAWHMRNGNTVSLEGHTFKVPLMYEPEISKGGSQIDIAEDRRLFTIGSFISVESKSKLLDQTAVNRWQSALISALNQHSNNIARTVPLTLHGKKLTFICVDTIFVSQESLICHAIGSDITASTYAPSDRIEQTRAILETSN